MNTLITALFNKKTAIFASGTGLVLASGIASADISAAITSAFAGANTNMNTVVTGLIALAAIVTGVGLIWNFLVK
jgi:hypothetical protein